MAKGKVVFFCKECGMESPKWLGQCPGCKAWNSLVEAPQAGKVKSAYGVSPLSAAEPVLLSEVDTGEEERMATGIGELDRVLGGGIVVGSLVLVGGDPGIGKSTLLLQMCYALAKKERKVLYVSGEESLKQVKMRAQRLGGEEDNCYIFCHTCIEDIISQAEQMQPALMIVDSVQTMYTGSIESTPGSVSQIKEVAACLLRYAKESGVPVILIGHITKDGYIAGPKILEHIVDVVLQFEGENRGSYRVLRSIKNRFGSTSELAVFEMTGTGLREVTNPSEMLIPMHQEQLSGTAIAVSLDGTRPLLFEVQALVSSAVYGTAQRSATGFDTRRLNMLLAVLEKRAGFKLSAKDVFLNMAGGLKVSDPACDLAVVCAVLSSNFDFAIPADVCFAAEVGLSGEIRPVAQADRRIAEALRLGFKKIYLSSYASIELQHTGIDIIKVADIPALVRKLFK